MTAAAAKAHKWEFKARFRRHAFGWRSQPAIQRIKQAVNEIKKVARNDEVLAADGALALLERISPALEQGDSSSGTIGRAVNHAIAELVPIMAGAPIDPHTRDLWLERLWAAHEADEVPYIEQLADHWGELCASKEVASAWADRLVDTTRLALSPRGACTVSSTARLRASAHSFAPNATRRSSTSSRLTPSGLTSAGRCWRSPRWARSPRPSSTRSRAADRGRTTVRSMPCASRSCCHRAGSTRPINDKHYGRTQAPRILQRSAPWPRSTRTEDLVKTTPGEEGKWFAAAKEAGLYEEALALATLTPCDPKTLTRAARDLADEQPDFALGAGMLALHWLVKGYGYEITGIDVWAAYSSTIAAAEKKGNVAQVRERVRQMVESQGPGGFVRKILGGALGL